MDFSFLAIIFVFGVLVFIHELGHFLAAKLMGVRVERFSVGFPPRIFGKKIGDTDYCISAIPFGGYVKLSGMVDESMDTESTGADYEFNSKPVWKRFVIMVAGVLMNFVLAVIILIVINYSAGKNILPYTTVGTVAPNGIAEKTGFKPGDRIENINGVEVETWNDVLRQYIDNLNNDINFIVKRDGQNVRLTFEREWFKQENAERFDAIPQLPNLVGDVITDMPAGKIGLQKGDRIVNVAGIQVASWNEMTDAIRQYPGEKIKIGWLRDGQYMESAITPNPKTETDSTGVVHTVGQIGVSYYYEHQDVSFGTAVVTGFNSVINSINLNAKAIWWVISGTKSAKEIMGGPIMIAELATKSASQGWIELWLLIAQLSAVLAFINILPIPALDGGHIVLLLIEAVRGKPLSLKARLTIQQVGMAILFTLIIFIIYIDLKRLLF